MGAHFTDENNSRLVHLMTIARMPETPDAEIAVVNELLHGNVVLLVPTAEPGMEADRDNGSVFFTHAPNIDGVLTLFAFTGEAALRAFTTDEICCMGLPSGDLLRACVQQGFGAILLDPDTPNEICVAFTPSSSGEN